MKNNIVVKNYQSILGISDTQLAIKLVKDTFQKKLSENLGLTRVSAPLFVKPETGLNDNLNGYEKAVNFIAQESKANLEIVQSLAKWKRYALNKYHVSGLYTDMNAIEDLDNLHSLYVDQWDWEKRITREERNEEYLKETVRKIYKALLSTSEVVNKAFPKLTYDFPNDITFVTTEELEEKASIKEDVDRFEPDSIKELSLNEQLEIKSCNNDRFLCPTTCSPPKPPYSLYIFLNIP